MPTRYLIVGQGVAGIAAAEAIRAVDAGGEITLLSDDPHGYYSRPGLAYYLTGEITRAHLFPWRDAEFAHMRLGRVQSQANALDPAGHRLLLTNGAALSYDRLLLATGSAAIRPNLPGSDLPQVVTLDNLADAERILALARKARAAVVVGGGITALEIVEGLHEHCRHIHYLLRSERYWGNVLDETEGRIVLERLAAEGVQVHFHTELAAIEHDVNRLRLLVGPTTLFGAVLMGDQRLSRPLQHLIAEQIDITPIRSQLLAPNAPLAALLTRLAEGLG